MKEWSDEFKQYLSEHFTYRFRTLREAINFRIEMGLNI